MVKYKIINGIANNFCNSLISNPSYESLWYPIGMIGEKNKENPQKLSFNLKKNEITPSNYDDIEIKSIIKNKVDFLYKEIEKLNIKVNEIDSVIVFLEQEINRKQTPGGKIFNDKRKVKLVITLTNGKLYEGKSIGGFLSTNRC
ncbi:hypothetical protein HYW75_02920 [Candidatus Pacearchaeota archaeon]|nr:hypothetical protein [Candidatus Pacearchaeota archaeon]